MKNTKHEDFMSLARQAMAAFDRLDAIFAGILAPRDNETQGG